jgi:hypothetical protein
MTGFTCDGSDRWATPGAPAAQIARVWCDGGDSGGAGCGTDRRPSPPNSAVPRRPGWPGAVQQAEQDGRSSSGTIPAHRTEDRGPSATGARADPPTPRASQPPRAKPHRATADRATGTQRWIFAPWPTHLSAHERPAPRWQARAGRCRATHWPTACGAPVVLREFGLTDLRC